MKNARLLLGLLVLALAAAAVPTSLALGAFSSSDRAAGPPAKVAAAEIQLYADWNFVPYTGAACAAAGEGFAQLVDATVLNIAWHHENQTKVWTSFDPDVPPVINDLETLCPNDVLVINVTSNIVWNP
ncbi:MAG: hypothetical protein HYY03_02595 [Chloroflexi bacterium]|nr:hypothetical protein [Chloroflexota bacterium]